MNMDACCPNVYGFKDFLKTIYGYNVHFIRQEEAGEFDRGELSSAGTQAAHI